MTPDIYYRYEDWQFDDPLDIELPKPIELKVIATTPKGVRVAQFYTNKLHLIIHSHKKKYAYPTAIEALKSYIARKEKQLQIIAQQIETTEQRLAVANELQKKVQQ